MFLLEFKNIFITILINKMSSYQVDITNTISNNNFKPTKVVVKMLCHFYIDGKPHKSNYTFPSTDIMEKATLNTNLPSTTKVDGFEVTFIDTKKKFIYKFPRGSIIDIEVNATKKIKIDIHYENFCPKLVINNNNENQPTSVKKYKKYLLF
ncbi:putative ORFan [Tupanvirus deep ocean]|uniref:ORFan n=2 Tax=Tupanvirus TaxID=2094720 RepID=A0AC62A6Z2_9VIRU|nr:putative ORFan [Tupanvirus deep ocean]QKU33524.1 putative ORFan [Tupanvirus deep ocean]